MDELTSVTSGTLTDARRVVEAKRLDVVRNGGVSRLIKGAYAWYDETKHVYNTIVELAKILQANIGECVNGHVEDCSNVIGELADEQIIDDDKFTKLIVDIKKADPMTALLLSKRAFNKAHKVADAFDEKIRKMKLKDTLNGATQAEADTALTLCVKLEKIRETVKARIKTVKYLNYAIAEKMAKLVEERRIIAAPTGGKLTPSQKAALEAMK